MNQNQQQQFKIQASKEDLKGVYSNVMRTSHTREEFALDFLNVLGQEGVLATRVIMSPGHLKRMISALQENLDKYEQKFGKIEPSDEPKKEEIGFKSPQE